jgi:hypothetical protein
LIRRSLLYLRAGHRIDEMGERGTC